MMTSAHCHSHCARSGRFYGLFILKDVTLELSSQSGDFLGETVHLILELSQNNQLGDTVDLLSSEWCPGTWDTNQILILPKIYKEIMLSIFMESGTEERQLLGCAELDRSTLYDRLGKQIDVPLLGDMSMVLKMKVVAISKEDIHGLALDLGDGENTRNAEIRIHGQVKNAVARMSDFERNGDLESLEKAISQFHLVAEVVSKITPYQSAISDSLGKSLLYRFEHLKQIDDLDNGVRQLQAAVNITADSHPDKPDFLCNLGDSLLIQFEHFGNIEDLNGAITQQQMADNLTPNDHPDKSSRLNNLGNSLVSRFEHLGHAKDLDDAIVSQQAALNLMPDGHPDKPGVLDNLGNSLIIRFEHFGNIDDLRNAVVQYQEAVNLTTDGHPDKPGLLTNLGNSLAAQFKRFRDLDDLDNAIAQKQLAVDLIPDGHHDKPRMLTNLGNSLETRFNHFGDAGDLNHAIAWQQAAVNLTPDDHPNKPGLMSNLGNSIEARFKCYGSISDLYHAIAQQQAAVDLTPDGHPHKPRWLSNLGNSLKSRFKRFSDVGDLDRAIALQQVAVNLTPDGHLDRPSWLNNLGDSLQTRYDHFGNVHDLDHAISQQQGAVNLTPDGHPDKSDRLHNLGNAFQSRFIHFHHSSDAEAAISHYSASTQSPTGTPSHRLTSAKSWVNIASMINHPTLLTAYESALTIMPRVAWLGLSIENRHKHLVQMGSIAQDAAAAAISLQHYDKAVEFLEQGRSIVWTQILQLRTPVDQLRDVDPDVANDFLRVSRLLDSGVQQSIPGEGEKSTPEAVGRRYRALAEEWERIIKRVRELPGFDDFLRPLRFSRLLGAARNGPVVLVNIAKERCDALALVDGLDMVVHIPLQNLTLKKTKKLQRALNRILQSQGVGLRAIYEPYFEHGVEGECKQILGELWDSLVKPVMDSLALSPHPDTLPRMWWCVNGPLAFLPIHAAGNYDEESLLDGQIHDYVISSYTPTLTTLLESPNIPADSPFKMLSVINPSTRRWHIPKTKVELAHIRRHLKDRDHIVLEDVGATKKQVIQAMKSCQWIHFACHGFQKGTQSALNLHGGDLTLEEIIKLDLPHAEFAYLSACQTVAGEQSLSSEAVHLAGGMLLAGYQSVVATMWSIKDDIAQEVADEFYRYLMEDGERPDSRKTAEALHLSVRKLRKKPGISMVSWIPFVHIGM